MKNTIVHILLIGALSSFSLFSSSKEEILVDEEEITINFSEFVRESYAHIGTSHLYLKPYELALKGYYKLLASGKLTNTKYITIVDMTKSANEKRMFILETGTWQVVHTSLVAHGVSTGNEYASEFSNIESSHQSSLGFFITGEVYNGKHDKSLKLDGQEYSNDLARERGVVVHAADYVSEDFIKENGRLGRSYGCPAIPFENYDAVIDKIKDGSCYFVYYPDKEYLKKSKIINSNASYTLNCQGELVN